MKYRIFATLFVTGAAAALPAAPAHALQTPTPTPRSTRSPEVLTLPGLENFDLDPNRRRATPTPAPPTPAATPAPSPRTTPSARPSPAATPSPRVTPAARPAPTSVPSPGTAPSPAASPAVLPSPIPTPDALPEPLPSPVESPVLAEPVPAVIGEDPFAWLWLAIPGGLLLAALLWWLLGTRRRKARERAVVEEAAPAPATAPVPPPAPVPVTPPAPVPVAPRPAPVAPPPPPAPPPAPASQQLPDDPFVIEVRPDDIVVLEDRVDLRVEVILGNGAEIPSEGIRLTLAMASTRPDQDQMLAAFHAAPTIQPVSAPFDLPAKSGTRVPGVLSLARGSVHVVDYGGRPMFVPLVMIDVRWRDGLSIRRFAADFMVHSGGQGGRLGPIWLDRGDTPQRGLIASRYKPRTPGRINRR